MIARSFAHSSPGCEPIGVILTFCASAGNAASKRANAAQAIFMSFLLKSLILGWPVVARRRIRRVSVHSGQMISARDGEWGSLLASVCAQLATEAGSREKISKTTAAGVRLF